MAQPIFQILLLECCQHPNVIFPPYKPATESSKLKHHIHEIREAHLARTRWLTGSTDSVSAANKSPLKQIGNQIDSVE